MKNEKDFTANGETLEHTMESLCELVLNDDAHLRREFNPSWLPANEAQVVTYVTEQLFNMCEGFKDRKGRMLYIDKLFQDTLKRLRSDYLSELEDIDFSDEANLHATIYNLNEFQVWHLGKMLVQYSESDDKVVAR